jgi:hypothetical protein
LKADAGSACASRGALRISIHPAAKLASNRNGGASQQIAALARSPATILQPRNR